MVFFLRIVTALVVAWVVAPAASSDLKLCRDTVSSNSEAGNLKVVVSDAMETMCKDPPVVKFEEMLERCAAFCGDSKISTLMGTEGAGLLLSEMDSYCVGDGADEMSLLYNDALMTQCRGWSTASAELKDSVSDLTAFSLQVPYELVRFQTKMQEMVHGLRNYMQSKDFVQEISDAPPSEKITKTKVNIKNYINDQMGTTSMKSDVEKSLDDFISRAESLADKMPQHIADIYSFMQNCTKMMLGTGGNDQYLLDICSVSGAQCIDHEEAGHIGCCCATIPAVSASPIPAMTGKGARRRLDEGADPDPDAEAVDPDLDICGKAYERAAPPIQKIVTEVQATAIGRSALQAFGASQTEKYEDFYSSCDGARRLSESGPAARGGSRTRQGVEQGRSLAYLTCDEPPPQDSITFKNANLKVVFDGQTEKSLCKDVETGGSESYFADKCEKFCGNMTVPLVLGEKSSFGFDLTQMDEICLKPTSEEVFKESYVNQCHEWANAFDDIIDKTSDLVAFVNLLDASMVYFKSSVKNISIKLQDAIRHQAPKIFDDASAGEKMNELKKLVQSVWRDSGFSTAKSRVQSQAEKVQDAANRLEASINVSVPKVKSFMDQCGEFVTGVGPESEYLLDLCSQNSKDCIHHDKGRHMGCCCAYNPLTSLGKQGVTTTIPGRRSSSVLTTTTRSAPSDSGIRDVCADASDKAATEMSNYRKDLGPVEWDRWQAEKSKKYPAFYCRCKGQIWDGFLAKCQSQSPSPSPRPGAASWASRSSTVCYAWLLAVAAGAPVLI